MACNTGKCLAKCLMHSRCSTKGNSHLKNLLVSSRGKVNRGVFAWTALHKEVGILRTRSWTLTFLSSSIPSPEKGSNISLSREGSLVEKSLPVASFHLQELLLPAF